MFIDQFNNTIDIWITELEQYRFDELLAKPDAAGWSLGQVFMHVIEDTRYYIEQIEFCLNHCSFISENMSESAKAMFLKNELPDVRIKGDPSVSENVRQPVSKELLQEEMMELKQEMNMIWKKIIDSGRKGKAKHPGLGYFSEQEWVQFAEMHLRHHLKQKERLDILLAKKYDRNS